MSGRYRGADGVEQLLKIARAEADVVRLDLGDIDRARISAAEAIVDIAAATAREEAASKDAAAFAAYAEAMRERRFNLTKTLGALETACEETQSKLTDALTEIAKLERLADINAREALTERRRREARRDAEFTPSRAGAQKALDA